MWTTLQRDRHVQAPASDTYEPKKHNTIQSHVKSSIPAVEVFTFHQKYQWTQDHSLCFIEEKHLQEDFFAKSLTSPVGVLTVYIHNPKKDGISRRVHESRQYEPEVMKLIIHFLGSESGMSFIDIGANIGLHSLVAAKYGRNVLAIEMMRENVQHLVKSAEYNHIQSRIKVVYNALGNTHTLSKAILGKNGRFGGGYINSLDIDDLKRRFDGDIYNSIAVNVPTVMLDDLLLWKHYNQFQKSFIKIDVEGSEASVMEGAMKFFNTINVTGIFMEWRWHKTRPHTAQLIISIMESLKLIPFAPFITGNKNTNAETTDVKEVQELFTHRLDFEHFSSWPHDVLWLPVVR